MEENKNLDIENMFKFKGSKIRVILDENGSPWWIAKDVCDSLGIKHSWDAVSKLDESN